MKKLHFDYAGTSRVCLHIYASAFNKLEPLCKLRFKGLTEHHYRLYQAHVQIRAYSLRFRFDKSPRNFSIRKFQLTNDPILDPVSAAISCFDRADLHHVHLWEPIGAFGSVSRKYYFLREFHISAVMTRACVLAYPDPTRYIRVHIAKIVPHSIRY
jgi:hypothetical protein